jgi:putative endopeptidase
MRSCFALLCCLLAAFACTPLPAQDSPAKAPAALPDGVPKQLPQLSRVDSSWIDKTKNPCDDYFQYACSKWIVAHPIPASASIQPHSARASDGEGGGGPAGHWQ